MTNTSRNLTETAHVLDSAIRRVLDPLFARMKWNRKIAMWSAFCIHAAASAVFVYLIWAMVSPQMLNDPIARFLMAGFSMFLIGYVAITGIVLSQKGDGTLNAYTTIPRLSTIMYLGVFTAGNIIMQFLPFADPQARIIGATYCATWPLLAGAVYLHHFNLEHGANAKTMMQ